MVFEANNPVGSGCCVAPVGVKAAKLAVGARVSRVFSTKARTTIAAFEAAGRVVVCCIATKVVADIDDGAVGAAVVLGNSSTREEAQDGDRKQTW